MFLSSLFRPEHTKVWLQSLYLVIHKLRQAGHVAKEPCEGGRDIGDDVLADLVVLHHLHHGQLRVAGPVAAQHHREAGGERLDYGGPDLSHSQHQH